MQLRSALSLLLLGQVSRGAPDAWPAAEPQDYSSRFMNTYSGDSVDIGKFGTDHLDGGVEHFQEYMKEFAPDYLTYTKMRKANDVQYKKWVQMQSAAGGESSEQEFTPATGVDQTFGSRRSQVVELAAGPVHEKAQQKAKAQAESVSKQQEEGGAAATATKAIQKLHDLLPKNATSDKIEAKKIAAAIVAGVEDDLHQQHEELMERWDHKLKALGHESLAHASHDEAEQAVKAAEDAEHRLHDLDYEAAKKMRHSYRESRRGARAEACKLGKQAKEAARRAKKLGGLVEGYQRKAGMSEEVYERAEGASERTSEWLEDAAETARERVEDALEQKYQEVENLVEKHMDEFADEADNLHRERRQSLHHAQQAMIESRRKAREQERKQRADRPAATAAGKEKGRSSQEKQGDKQQKSSPAGSGKQASDKNQGIKAPTQFLARNSAEALSIGTSGRVLPVDVFATLAFLGCVIAVAGVFYGSHDRQLNIEEQPALG